MKYFLPYWEDWVHRDFDREKDSFGAGGFKNSLFAHELFSAPLYDGILVSLGLLAFKFNLIKENGKPKIREYTDIKKYLRLPRELRVLGDCGAFTYINEKKPFIEVSKAVTYYHKLKFDFGISVDHICADSIVVPPSKVKDFFYFSSKELSKDKVRIFLKDKEKEFRRKLSIKNAEKFLKLSEGKGFTPIGAVQGYSVESYLDSAKQLISMGYQYIALGGLIFKSSEFIAELLDKLYREIDTQNIKVHLLGILREELLNKMILYNIYSFDSASYYRKSWLRANKNYLGVDGKWYASIRVPQTANVRIIKKIKRRFNLRKLVASEKRIMKNLRKYDRGKIQDIDALVEEIINYDKVFFRGSFKEEKFYTLYRDVLLSKIWKKCNCDVCKELSIDVIIFRGSDRNKRRGFHNTFVFYNQLQERVHSLGETPTVG